MSFPELTDIRRRVGDALVEASASVDATRLLGVAPGLLDTVRDNARLWDRPAKPAAEVYDGVLYEALGWSELATAARRRARSRVLVISALWGAVGLHDRIPAYRLPICAQLPGMPGLEALWRSELERVLPAVAGNGLIVDCRSSSFVAAWRPSGPLAQRWVEVKVYTEVAGRRTTVSHMAKHTRGLVAAALLASSKDPRRVSALPQLLPDFRTELTEPRRTGQPWSLAVLTA